MFTHDCTCSAAKQAVTTANACTFHRFRMTARACDWMLVRLPELPGMQIASLAPYYVKTAKSPQCLWLCRIYLANGLTFGKMYFTVNDFPYTFSQIKDNLQIYVECIINDAFSRNPFPRPVVPSLFSLAYPLAAYFHKPYPSYQQNVFN
jgi:hypothetical protein